jgi:hypothetical protein
MAIELGQSLDTAVCKHVLGMSDEKIARLIATKRLPRYSTDYRQANALHHHFREVGGDMEALFNEALGKYVPDGVVASRKWATVSIVCSLPSSVCDAALAAVGYTVPD